MSKEDIKKNAEEIKKKADNIIDECQEEKTEEPKKKGKAFGDPCVELYD